MNLEKFWDRLPDNRMFGLLRRLVTRYQDHDLNRAAAALTYYLVFIIFPTLSFASSLLAAIQLPPIKVTSWLHTFLPLDILSIVNSFLEYLNATPSTGVLWGSAALALYFTYRAVEYLIFCVSRASGTQDKRSFLQHSAVVLIFTAALPLALFSAFVLLVAGESLLTFLSAYLPINAWSINLWTSIRFLILAVILFAVLCLLYWLGPGVRMPLRKVIPGAVVSLLSWLVYSAGFSFYVEHMGNYSVVYGSIGAVIVLLLWLYFSSLTLLIGAEFNEALEETRRRGKH